MANRKRDVMLRFRVSESERKLIEKKMEQTGIINMAAYLRKMALDGYVVNLDLPELQEISSLMRRSSNNLNQIARRANETRRVYDEDIQEIIRLQGTLLERFGKILTALSRLA